MIFTPQLLSKERKRLFLLFLLGTLIVFSAVFHLLIGTYYSIGIMTSELTSPVLILVFIFGSAWLVVIGSALWNAKHQKIEIADGLLLSTSQFIFFSPIFKIINLKAVKNIKDREERRIVPTGRSIIVILIYHLVFEQANGDKQEISMIGWNKESVKEMLLHISQLYPEIFIQTYAFREPSEKILKDYLPLVKKVK